MRARFWRCYAIQTLVHSVCSTRAYIYIHARFQPPSSISLSMFLPQFACIHTDTGLTPVFDWLSVSGVGRGLQAAARRLGDLRSDFKLYLGMDRSIYLRGVAAIMHGLTVSVAGKLTRYCREKLLPFFSPRFLWSAECL